MLSRTRGVELLSIMKADTYLNILALVDDYHYLKGCEQTFSAQQESLVGMLRKELAQITEVRALRLSDEASSLPPTHFLLITSLSFVSIVAYVTASLAVVDDLGAPPQEASLLFAGLAALYVLFFNFCRDLNGPFRGVYQIKRSNAVSHLLQTKWLIVSQLGDDVTFASDYAYVDERERKSKEETEMKEVTFLDKIKGFFSGSEAEDINAVEAEMYSTLVNEMDGTSETMVGGDVESSINENAVNDTEEEPIEATTQPDPVSISATNNKEGTGDLCDIAQPATMSLDCSDDDELDCIDFDDELELIDFDEEDMIVCDDATISSEETAAVNDIIPEKMIEQEIDHTIGSSSIIKVKKTAKKNVSKKVDLASYFRSAGGFSV